MNKQKNIFRMELSEARSLRDDQHILEFELFRKISKNYMATHKKPTIEFNIDDYQCPIFTYQNGNTVAVRSITFDDDGCVDKVVGRVLEEHYEGEFLLDDFSSLDYLSLANDIFNLTDFDDEKSND